MALIVCAVLLAAAASPVFAETMAVEQDGSETPGGENPVATTEDGSDVPDDADDPLEPPPPVSIVVTEYPSIMTVGDRGAIKYEINNAEAGAKVKWESGDDDIATVDAGGAVRAFAPGKVEITASLGDARASILISVEEKVILPESFSVEVEGFTAADTLLARHDLNIGDELRMSVKVNPPDADINGTFEWDTDGDGIAAIEVSGERGENAVFTAKTAGEVTLSVRYVDETEDASKRVSLGDSMLVFNIVKVEEEPADSMLMTILIAAAAVGVIVLVTVLIVKGRRRAENERRARAARKKRDMAARENAERERLLREGYERGYRDSEADRFEGMTKIYDDLPTGSPEFGPQEFGQPEYEPQEFGQQEFGQPEYEQTEFEPPDTAGMNDGYEPEGEGNEPEKPFSVDDIE
jgi:hypothetical protein